MRYHEIQIRQHQAARLLARNFKNTNSSIIGSGLMLCRRCKWFHTTDPDNARIDVFEHRAGRYVAHMRDVATCGNAHLCPYCGLVLASHNSAWIEQVLVPAVEVSNKTMSLLTLTAFHQRESDWTDFASCPNSLSLPLAVTSRRAKTGYAPPNTSPPVLRIQRPSSTR